ncbi:MAG: diaminopimelate decarboxylase [Desulfatiglandaceae bacterium]
MHHFHYIGGRLHCEDVPVEDLANSMGTPFYLYSHATLVQHFNAFDDSFRDVPHLTCFSVKSNSNLGILRLFADKGGGADIVSGGELYRCLAAGVQPEKIVYSGVGKKSDEMAYALDSGILMFNIESGQELEALSSIAEEKRARARVAFRVNPDVDPRTHPYISTGLKENKFGIDIHEAPKWYKAAAELPNLEVAGVSCHIGSQLTEISPFVEALRKLKGLIEGLKADGHSIRYLDLGGGLGITYDHEIPPHPSQYARAIKDELGDCGLVLIFEPGRVIMGNAGVLITRVLYTKSTSDKSFVVVDAAMNDLMRPALYNSYHAIQPVQQAGRPELEVDVVGPICESGDFLAKKRILPQVEQGELLAVMSSGAYGFSMSSNYNSRPRVCEVMVKGATCHVIRTRETYEDLIRRETIPDFLGSF